MKEKIEKIIKQWDAKASFYYKLAEGFALNDEDYAYFAAIDKADLFSACSAQLKNLINE